MKSEQLFRAALGINLPREETEVKFDETSVEKYYKDESWYSVSAKLELAPLEWADVLEALRILDCICYRVSASANIDEQIDFVAEKTSIPGVEFINLIVDR